MSLKSNCALLRPTFKYILMRNGGSTYSHGSTLRKEDFYDHTNIFQFKTTWELFRGAMLLKLCSFDWLVDNSMRVSTFVIATKTIKGHIFLFEKKKILFDFIS